MQKLARVEQRTALPSTSAKRSLHSQNRAIRYGTCEAPWLEQRLFDSTISRRSCKNPKGSGLRAGPQQTAPELSCIARYQRVPAVMTVAD